MNVTEISPGTDSLRPASGWNPCAHLRCLFCEQTQPLGPYFSGCPECAEKGIASPLEVVYDDDGPGARDLGSVLSWLAGRRQPMASASLVTLGRTVTPLTAVPAFGQTVLVKNETLNPTWSHKDRVHEVNLGAARLLGSKGVVASSTGNHGASAAAHAAAAGLPSVIFCHPEASEVALQMITAYGGQVVQIDPAGQRDALNSMVDDGWFPATSMDPAISGRSNPYGAEGYKAVAYEIAAALGRLPDVIVVPTASGDTLYGIAKGFDEISSLTGTAAPRIVAAQPALANPLERSMENGNLTRVEDAHSVALSVAEKLTGRQAMTALARWHGETVSVSEESILAAYRGFAGAGLLVEPASAVSLAGYREIAANGRIHEDASVVLLSTCAGIKWPSILAELFPVDVVRQPEEFSVLRQRIGG